MKIISIDTGTSNLKFNLFEMNDESVLASGIFEGIGTEMGALTLKYNGQKITQEVLLPSHVEAVKLLVEKLVALEIIHSYDDIKGVGHRIVHGGSKYTESCFITDQVIEDIDSFKDFAPLHNPAHILGIKAFREVLPDIPMVAVFDTSFHQTMEETEYIYPVPYQWYRNYGVRKYGAYGTSHRYITECVRDILGKEDFKLISCHIGNGGSITAIKDMKCVDTSMGFSPLAGIMMGTRSGNIDPAIIPYIMEKEGKNAGEVIEDLNTRSGLLGISEFSSDMRDIVTKCEENDPKAILAKNKFVRRIVDYIAQYYVFLGGCDMIVLTAGVGENNSVIRKEICDRLACLGVKIDLGKNELRGEVIKLSTPDSKIDVYVIPTNEELMIARDTLKLIKNR